MKISKKTAALGLTAVLMLIVAAMPVSAVFFAEESTQSGVVEHDEENAQSSEETNSAESEVVHAQTDESTITEEEPEEIIEAEENLNGSIEHLETEEQTEITEEETKVPAAENKDEEQAQQGVITPLILSGLLSLKSVPSFSFGANNAITHLAASYEGFEISGKIEISDARLISTGWRLTAQMGTFSNGVNSGVLSGAVLQLPKPELGFSGIAVQSPSAQAAQITAGEISAKNIMVAGIGVSLGTWTGEYLPENVFLNVAAGTAYAGTSTANIVWTLYDSP